MSHDRLVQVQAMQFPGNPLNCEEMEGGAVLCRRIAVSLHAGAWRCGCGRRASTCGRRTRRPPPRPASCSCCWAQARVLVLRLYLGSGMGPPPLSVMHRPGHIINQSPASNDTSIAGECSIDTYISRPTVHPWPVLPPAVYLHHLPQLLAQLGLPLELSDGTSPPHLLASAAVLAAPGLLAWGVDAAGGAIGAAMSGDGGQSQQVGGDGEPSGVAVASLRPGGGFFRALNVFTVRALEAKSGPCWKWAHHGACS